jgi:VanZ family protein
MFVRPPAQREWVSWLSAVLWSLLIFATIPLARAIERVVVDAWGEQFFLYAVLIVIGAAAVETFRQLRRLGTISRMRGVLLGGIALVFGAYTFSLRHNAVEAVHFVEYGVLGLLAYRALTHRTHDSAIYLAAACVAGIVGILDEGIQWATPKRVWDILDIWRNFFAAALVLVGIAVGIRPPLIADRPSAASIRLFCRLAAVAVLLLGASLLNTPARIGWYTERVPGLASLRESSDVMLEYGHLYTDSEIGLFTSRFPPDELRRVDEERGAKVGPILARYPEDAYGEFLARYTPITDPFAHEARVHLFRRDRYLEASTSYTGPEQHAREALTVGFREQLILEKYFPNTLRHSGSALTPERRAELADRQFADQPYESRVSKDLVTELGERDIVLGWLGMLALLVAIHRTAGRRSST